MSVMDGEREKWIRRNHGPEMCGPDYRSISCPVCKDRDLIVQQRFFRGDIVKVKQSIDPFNRHSPFGFTAVVVGSYFDMFYPSHTSTITKDNLQQYSLMNIETGNGCAWFYEDQLVKIGHMTEQEMRFLKLKR